VNPQMAQYGMNPQMPQYGMNPQMPQMPQYPQSAQYGVNQQIESAQMMRMMMGGGNNMNTAMPAGGMGTNPYMATPRFAAQAVVRQQQRGQAGAPGSTRGGWMQTPIQAKLAGLPTAGDALNNAWSNMEEASSRSKARMKEHKHAEPENDEEAGTDAARYMSEMDMAIEQLPPKHHPHRVKASNVGHRKFTMPPTPRGSGDLWKETAELIEEHDSLKAGGTAARFKSARVSATVTRADELATFYQAHNPAKTNQAASILKRYAGHEDLLWSRLKNKYGEVPTRRRVLQERRALTEAREVPSGVDEDEELRKGYDNPGMAIVMNAALHEELARSAEVGRRIAAMKSAMK